MTGQERVRTAMNLGIPDRVPVFCQLSIGHYFLNARPSPFDIWFRSAAFAEALVEMQQQYRFDGILVNLPGRDPQLERHVQRLEETHGQTVIHWKNGCFTRLPADDNPHFFQPDGTRAFPQFTDIDPQDLWYVEPWDITGVSCPYHWGFDTEPRPTEDFFPAFHLDTIAAVREKVGGTVSVHSEVFSPFSQFLELLDYQGALMALLDDAAKVHACLERLTEGAVDLACRQAAAGVDAVLISSAFAGSGFISRSHYRDFVLPWEKKLITMVNARHPDVSIYTHTCGGIGDRLDLMLATGTDGIDTLDPPPLGTIELEEAVAVLAEKVFIKGNIDPVHTLLQGNEAKVREAVLHRLRVAAPGGGYILSSACSVAPGVRPELLELMSAMAIELGEYD